MPTSAMETVSLREMTRHAVRQQIASRALALFSEHGFDATTIDSIAKEAGISPRSFFRYFPTKEDVVVGDQAALGRILVAALRARPSSEDVWASLGESMLVLLDKIHDDPLASLRGSKIVMTTESLRARHLEKRLAWEEELLPLVADRLGGDGAQAELRAHAIISAALSCLDAAVNEWARLDGLADVAQLLNTALAAVRPTR